MFENHKNFPAFLTPQFLPARRLLLLSYPPIKKIIIIIKAAIATSFLQTFTLEKVVNEVIN